jgi:predicted AAA+ superfamily ATPase
MCRQVAHGHGTSCPYLHTHAHAASNEQVKARKEGNVAVSPEESSVSLEVSRTHPRFHSSADLRDIVQRCHFLAVYTEVLRGPIGEAYLNVVETAADLESSRSQRAQFASRCARLAGLLAAEVAASTRPLVGDAWQDYLLTRLLADSNAFSRKASRAALAEIGLGLCELARLDLTLIRQLFLLNGAALAAVASAHGLAQALPYLQWNAFAPLQREGLDDAVTMCKRGLAEMADWSAALDLLATHYRQHGVGIFAHYRAFRWVRDQAGGSLAGIAQPDPIRLEELIGDERQRALLVQNTEQFLAGYPANNVLLFGDRGTGKSSTIKALLNRYADRGLRLVEVHKDVLEDFHRIVQILRDQPHRFIVFVDDLSFEPHESDYKSLKAILEGSVEAQPTNVVIYATSNRSHLIREQWSDRDGLAEGELHPRETIQELLSLSDRFGIRLTFTAPTQAQYLAIVSALASQRRLDIKPQELRARAIEWAQQRNGFSGRTARQFVDFLEGELGLTAAQYRCPSPLR